MRDHRITKMSGELKEKQLGRRVLSLQWGKLVIKKGTKFKSLAGDVIVDGIYDRALVLRLIEKPDEEPYFLLLKDFAQIITEVMED